MRASARRLRASLSAPACFRAAPAATTYAPCTSDGWTKTHVNWA